MAGLCDLGCITRQGSAIPVRWVREMDQSLPAITPLDPNGAEKHKVDGYMSHLVIAQDNVNGTRFSTTSHEGLSGQSFSESHRSGLPDIGKSH